MQRVDSLRTRLSRVTTEDVGMIFMTLTVNGRQVFSFSVGADGLFNRMGTGALHPAEPELCCGTVTPQLFHRVASGVTIDILRWKGSYSMPVRKGRRCELYMAILFKAGQEWTTRWQYGADSEGPPPEICSFIRRAIDLTDPPPDRQDLTGPTRMRAHDGSAESACSEVVDVIPLS